MVEDELTAVEERPDEIFVGRLGGSSVRLALPQKVGRDRDVFGGGKAGEGPQEELIYLDDVDADLLMSGATSAASAAAAGLIRGGEAGEGADGQDARHTHISGRDDPRVDSSDCDTDLMVGGLPGATAMDGVGWSDVLTAFRGFVRPPRS